MPHTETTVPKVKVSKASTRSSNPAAKPKLGTGAPNTTKRTKL